MYKQYEAGMIEMLETFPLSPLRVLTRIQARELGVDEGEFLKHMVQAIPSSTITTIRRRHHFYVFNEAQRMFLNATQLVLAGYWNWHDAQEECGWEAWYWERWLDSIDYDLSQYVKDVLAEREEINKSHYGEAKENIVKFMTDGKHCEIYNRRIQNGDI